MSREMRTLVINDLTIPYLFHSDKRLQISPNNHESTGSREDHDQSISTSGVLHQMSSYPVAIKPDRESPKEHQSGGYSSFLTLTPPKAISNPPDKDGHYQHLSAHAHIYGSAQNAGLNMGIVAS